MHYDNLFSETFQYLGHDVVYQPTCLQTPYDVRGWPIRYPEVNWTDSTVVVMHTQDFLTINSDGKCPEVENIEKHFGSRARQVVIIHWNYNLQSVYTGPCHLMYFPTHSYEIMHRLKNPPYLNWQKKFQQPRTRNWQCLNGAARPHRICVYNMLKDYTGGTTCLGNIDPLPVDAYHDVMEWEPGVVDLNEGNFVRLSWLYATTWINIVTETQYVETPGIITEKTLLALLACQIPILIGYKGIVSHCRELGFDMFDDIVDNSYDYLDDGIRYQQALELNKDLLINTPDLSHLQDRFNKQQNYVLNIWPSVLVDNFQTRAKDISNCLTKI